MKLEKIEERQDLWPEYWDYIMEQQRYGEPPVSFWDKVFRPVLRVEVISFDQWLFKRQRYDLVDFRDFEPWEPIGRISMFSTADMPERSAEDLMKIWQETGNMIVDTKPRRLNKFFKPAFGDTVDEWGYKIENTIAR